jgi:hypothetical protein
MQPHRKKSCMVDHSMSFLKTAFAITAAGLTAFKVITIKCITEYPQFGNNAVQQDSVVV